MDKINASDEVFLEEVNILSKHTKLTLAERKLLASWKEAGFSMRECAKRLSRSVSTVSRELFRNRFVDKDGLVYYLPTHAQSKFERVKENAWKAKIALKNIKVQTYVLDHLRLGWSPEQISGRLKFVDHVDDRSWQISPETIYKFVYHRNQKDKRWWEYLRRKQKRRKAKSGRKSHRCRIPDRISISQRPKEADERIIVGHWEDDTVVGKGRNHGIHTAYERVSSYIRMEYLPDLTALSCLKAQRKIYGSFPTRARMTVTEDNGHEHVLHQKLKGELGIQTYFAHPYSSWERGGNENANLWIRYYFPKGTNFSTISKQELQDVEWELNNRPRRRLKFFTPSEVFSKHLRVLR